MLKSIYIKNFALIEQLDLEFNDKLNIITGETGAGKSIIVDALMILLGERASTEFIRNGENKAIIEAVFDPPSNFSCKEEFINAGVEFAENNEILIRREINLKGSSRCFVNDTPVSVALLKQLGDLLVDFHGQHDHQILLRNETHINILDVFANDSLLLNNYKYEFEQQNHLLKHKKELVSKEKQLRRQLDIWKFELDEIQKIAPLPNEDELLEQELKIIQNSELLNQSTTELYTLLYEAEDSVHDKLNHAQKILKQLETIDNKFTTFGNECASALISLDEIAKYANDYAKQIEYEPLRIEQIQERLLKLNGLRKKYGSFEEITKYEKELLANLNLVENFDEEINSINQQIEKSRLHLGSLAMELSQRREVASVDFAKKIVSFLKNLGIEHSVFKVNITQERIQQVKDYEGVVAQYDKIFYNANNDGIDKIEFIISTNKGETPKPLVNVASGGEISRIMLSIKSIVANSDGINTLVFDEIDTGISGRIAQKVGAAMKKLSAFHQIISITHLPQIAALGDANIYVNKTTEANKTYINARFISPEEKTHEIARLISGESITEAALKSAEELCSFDVNLM